MERLGQWFNKSGLPRPARPMYCVDARDPFGRRVRCGGKWWDEHILLKYEMRGAETEVGNAITTPFQITSDAHKPHHLCYYGLASDPQEEYKVKVSVKIMSKTGWIVTAYRVSEVPPNEPIFWEPS